MKSYHNTFDSFDTKIQCEEFYTGYEEWSDEDQKAWEAEQERLKNWTGDYSSDDSGETFEGIAI